MTIDSQATDSLLTSTENENFRELIRYLNENGIQVNDNIKQKLKGDEHFHLFLVGFGTPKSHLNFNVIKLKRGRNR
jgi:hypothetical protein